MKYIVFTMDGIASKKVNNVTAILEEKALILSRNPERNTSFLTDVKVLVGDEIQVAMPYHTDFVKYIRYLREVFIRFDFV